MNLKMYAAAFRSNFNVQNWRWWESRRNALGEVLAGSDPRDDDGDIVGLPTVGGGPPCGKEDFLYQQSAIAYVEKISSSELKF